MTNLLNLPAWSKLEGLDDDPVIQPPDPDALVLRFHSTAPINVVAWNDATRERRPVVVPDPDNPARAKIERYEPVDPPPDLAALSRDLLIRCVVDDDRDRLVGYLDDRDTSKVSVNLQIAWATELAKNYLTGGDRNGTGDGPLSKGSSDGSPTTGPDGASGSPATD